MAVKIKGSAFYFGQEVEARNGSFEEYFKWLINQDRDKPWPYHKEFDEKKESYKRELFIDSNQDYWFGLFISAKTRNFQHYVNRIGNIVTIEQRSVNGNPPVEVNFFCIRKDSQKGLYSHHSGSYSFGIFINNLWASYRSFINCQKAIALSSCTKDKEKKKIKQQYSIIGKNQTGPLFLPDDFDRLIDRLKCIDKVQATSYSIDSPADRAVRKQIRHVHSEYKFDITQQTNSKTRRWLKDLRFGSEKLLNSGKKIFKGKIYGLDQNDSDLTIDFEKTMKNHLDFDYDNLGSFNIADIFNHDIIKQMTLKMGNMILFKPGR